MGARGHCRLALSALALTGLSLFAPVVRAAADEIPAECGTRADFDSQLRQRLGPNAPLASVRVAISQQQARYHLRVAIGDELRELEDESCAELLRAAVVVAVAMLLHEQTPPETAPPTTPVAAESKPQRERPRLWLSLGGGINVGTLPSPTPILELEAQALWRQWGAALGLRYLAPSKELDDLDRGAILQAVGAQLTGIFRPSPSWQARLGFAAQRLHGEGQGSRQTQTANVWAAGPTLGLGFIPYQHGRLWLGLAAEGQLNAVRGKFQIRNYNQRDDRDVHQVPWLSASAFVRLGLIW